MDEKTTPEKKKKRRPGHPRRRPPSRRHKSNRAKVERTKFYSLQEALELMKGLKSPKFDETVEISMKLGVDPRLRPICKWIEEHHERWDGQGYPFGLQGEAISLPGRILCMVEVLDALATRRSYKPPWPLEKIREFFLEQSGRAFDPTVCDRVLQALDEEGKAFFAPDPEGTR